MQPHRMDLIPMDCIARRLTRAFWQIPCLALSNVLIGFDKREGRYVRKHNLTHTCSMFEIEIRADHCVHRTYSRTERGRNDRY
jgi:hypothetical protein